MCAYRDTPKGTISGGETPNGSALTYKKYGQGRNLNVCSSVCTLLHVSTSAYQILKLRSSVCYKKKIDNNKK